MKFSLALFAVLEVKGQAPSFAEWAEEQGISFNDNSEKDRREQIYNERVTFINKVNGEQSDFALTWNKFAIFTNDEVRARFTGAVVPSSKDNSSAIPFVASQAQVQSIDWTSSGRVSRVKNQGSCGSCWAFAATGAVESAIAIAYNTYPPELSEEQLVDCSGEGCDGGWPWSAFGYYKHSGVVCDGASYPYTGTNSGACQSECQSFSVTWYGSGYTEVPAGDEYSLKSAVMNAPVTVTINAEDPFVYYSSGIVQGDCAANSIDHAVLMVGFGSGFLKLKNSWGAEWGDAGYIKVSSETNAFCITLYPPSYPTLGTAAATSKVSLKPPPSNVV